MSYESLMKKIRSGENGEIILSKEDYLDEMKDFVSVAELNKIQQDHNKSLIAKEKEFNTKLLKLKESHSLSEKLGTVKCKEGYSDLMAKLIDESKIEYDNEGRITGGFDNQIEDLKKSYADLFATSEAPTITGASFVKASSEPSTGTGLRGALMSALNTKTN